MTVSSASAASNKMSVDVSELEDQFRSALAWGATYGPIIPRHQWDEMREHMVKQHVESLA